MTSIQDQIRSTAEGFEVQDSFGQWHHVPASLQPAFGVIVQDGVLRPSAPGQEFADALDAGGRAELEHLLQQHGVLNGPLEKAGTVQALHLVRLVGTELWKATASAAPESDAERESLSDRIEDMQMDLEAAASVCSKFVDEARPSDPDAAFYYWISRQARRANELLEELHKAM